MGYFGKYSRIALALESQRDFVFTFNQFMHIYPFLREFSNNINNLDNDEEFKSYLENLYPHLTADEISNLIAQRSPFPNLNSGWQNVLDSDTPIWETNVQCVVEDCPAMAQIVIDPLYELVFMKYRFEHLNCSEIHKRRIYDIVKKCFVRFGGDLDLVNNLYVDMPRRYGIGFVESSLSYISTDKRSHVVVFGPGPKFGDMNNTNITTGKSSWASKLKRRTMYDVQSKSQIQDSELNKSTNDNLINLEGQPEWKVHVSKNASDDLVKIYKEWRRQYFQRQDYMWDSLSNKNWNTDFNLVERYWEMAQLKNVEFNTLSQSMIIAKSVNVLRESQVWIILEDESISSLVPLPKQLQRANENQPPLPQIMDWANQSDFGWTQYQNVIEAQKESNLLGVELGLDSVLPGVSNIKKSVLKNYETPIKMFRILDGETGQVAGFILCDLKDLWKSIAKMLKIEKIEDLNHEIKVLSTFNLDNRSLSNLKSAYQLPINIKPIVLDFFTTPLRTSALNNYFSPDILREFTYMLIEVLGYTKSDDYFLLSEKLHNNFAQIRELIKSKLPRQRAHANDPLNEPLQLSSPYIPNGGGQLPIVRVGNLTGTARVYVKSMMSYLEIIESNASKWVRSDLSLNERDGGNDEDISQIQVEINKLIGDLQLAVKWALEIRHLCEISTLIDSKYLKLLWRLDVQCDGNISNTNTRVGYGMDLRDLDIGPNIQLKGRGILGLVTALSEWVQ